MLAAAWALTAFLTVDIAELDPRLREPNAVAAIATVVAAGSLARRRTPARVAYGVFVAGYGTVKNHVSHLLTQLFSSTHGPAGGARWPRPS